MVYPSPAGASSAPPAGTAPRSAHTCVPGAARGKRQPGAGGTRCVRGCERLRAPAEPWKLPTRAGERTAAEYFLGLSRMLQQRAACLGLIWGGKPDCFESAFEMSVKFEDYFIETCLDS